MTSFADRDGTAELNPDEEQGNSLSSGFIGNRYNSVTEIIEEAEEEEGGGRNGDERMETIREEDSSVFSQDCDRSGGSDVVYVAIWKGSGEEAGASMDALSWALSHAVDPISSSIVYLVHVFPEPKFIPTPLGKLPISQANPEQKASFLVQERRKRSDFLQKFLDLCSASKVKVDTVMIESDMEAKAILDLIPILNIRRLVLGTTKASLRKSRSRRGSGTVVDQIVQNAPECCEVKIVCEGKEVLDDQGATNSPYRSPSPSPRGNVIGSPKTKQPVRDQAADLFRCSCFKPKAAP